VQPRKFEYIGGSSSTRRKFEYIGGSSSTRRKFEYIGGSSSTRRKFETMETARQPRPTSPQAPLWTGESDFRLVRAETFEKFHKLPASVARGSTAP